MSIDITLTVYGVHERMPEGVQLFPLLVFHGNGFPFPGYSSDDGWRYWDKVNSGVVNCVAGWSEFPTLTPAQLVDLKKPGPVTEEEMRFAILELASEEPDGERMSIAVDIVRRVREEQKHDNP